LDFTYPLYEDSGHIIAATDEQRLLVDTGSPWSVGRCPSIAIAGAEYPLHSSLMGQSFADLVELAGVDADCLLGMDVLVRYRLQLDLQAGQMVLGDDHGAIAATALAVRSVMGVPTVSARVEHSDLDAYVDTGARLSYIPSELAAGLAADQEQEDFYPGVGRFRTLVCRVSWQVGQVVVELECGSLPAQLEAALMVGGCRAILGAGLLRYARLDLSMTRGLLSLASHEGLRRGG
jgi:hypothetical protein